MRMYHIPPGPLSGLIVDQAETHHLIVANAFLSAGDETYRSFYLWRSQKTRDTFTIDNAMFEGATTSLDDMWNVAEQVGAQELILPDMYRAAEQTVRDSQRGYLDFQRRGFQGNFIGIPHGNTFAEYLWCAEQLAELGDQMQTFGVIEEIEELYNIPRHMAVAALKDTFPDHKIHLCGVSEDLDELYNPMMLQHVRSCDTAKFIVWGLNGMSIDPDRVHRLGVPSYPGRVTLGGRRAYFAYRTASEHALETAKLNITRVRRYLKEKEKYGV